MSFIKKAQEAAEAARLRMEEAAGTGVRPSGEEPTSDRLNRGLAGASQGAREALGLARRGVNTVIERIDPSTLAELIVRATALQEMTNKSLREKGSPYRIGEISISASIPPGVNFSISRIDDVEEQVQGVIHSSSELLKQAAEGGELVLALDGTTVDEPTASAIVEAAAVPGAMPPSAVARDG
jgi:hypothetical protein